MSLHAKSVFCMLWHGTNIVTLLVYTCRYASFQIGPALKGYRLYRACEWHVKNHIYQTLCMRKTVASVSWNSSCRAETVWYFPWKTTHNNFPSHIKHWRLLFSKHDDARCVLWNRLSSALMLLNIFIGGWHTVQNMPHLAISRQPCYIFSMHYKVIYNFVTL